MLPCTASRASLTVRRSCIHLCARSDPRGRAQRTINRSSKAPNSHAQSNTARAAPHTTPARATARRGLSTCDRTRHINLTGPSGVTARRSKDGKNSAQKCLTFCTRPGIEPGLCNIHPAGTCYFTLRAWVCGMRHTDISRVPPAAKDGKTNGPKIRSSFVIKLIFRFLSDLQITALPNTSFVKF